MEQLPKLGTAKGLGNECYFVQVIASSGKRTRVTTLRIELWMAGSCLRERQRENRGIQLRRVCNVAFAFELCLFFFLEGLRCNYFGPGKASKE